MSRFELPDRSDYTTENICKNWGICKETEPERWAAVDFLVLLHSPISYTATETEAARIANNLRELAERTTAETQANRTYEAVNNPDHYGGRNTPWECRIVNHVLGVSWAAGDALKYLCRAGKKPGVNPAQDYNKAAFYIEDVFVGEKLRYRA